MIEIDEDESERAAAGDQLARHFIGVPDDAAVATSQSEILNVALGGLLVVRPDLDGHHQGTAPSIEGGLAEKSCRQSPGRAELEHIAAREVGEFIESQCIGRSKEAGRLNA